MDDRKEAAKRSGETKRPGDAKRLGETKRPGEKRTNPFAGNAVWIFLGIGVFTLVLLQLMSSSSRVEIKFSDLMRIIEQQEVVSPPTPERSISEDNLRELVDGKEIVLDVGSGRRVRLSGLSHVVLGKQGWTATVKEQEISPAPAATASQVRLAVLPKSAAKPEATAKLEVTVDVLRQKLAQAGIPHTAVVGYHPIQEESKKKSIYRYSKLSELEISPYEINGKVVRRLEGAEDAKDETVSFTCYKGPSQEIAAELAAQLYAQGLEFDHEPGPSAWRSYIPLLLMIGLLVFLFFVMMRRIGGAGSPMAFGRTRGRLYAQDDVGVTFEDVAGIDEAVEELREVVEFLKFPEKYQALGGRIPKGVLLVGPPGTGKTLLAKAIAGEAGVPFFSLSGSDFVEMFVGVGAARVRDTFQQAAARAPAIIFIDELDALGKTRGTSVVGGHDEREQTLNALLVEMDGFDSNIGVIVLAATNRPETLDPALLRPGRFDRNVLVDRPDVRGREAILKVHVQHVKLDDTVDLKNVAAITPGFVGADLANLVNEAALLAARKAKSAVGMSEFNEGVERVTAGLEKKQRIMHVEEKHRVAYHEAGHALVAYSLPNTDPVHKVSIIPRGIAALGYTMQRPDQDRYLMTQGDLEARIQVLLAGTIAEELTFAEFSTGASNDLERATEIARSMVMEFGMSRLGRVNYRQSRRSPFLAGGMDMAETHVHSEQTSREIDEEVKRIIDESLVKVRDILQARRASLEALSQKLIEKETVDADELKQIIEATSPSPLIVPGTSDAVKKRIIPEPHDPTRRELADGR